jgi:hypothetical protein
MIICSRRCLGKGREEVNFNTPSPCKIIRGLGVLHAPSFIASFLVLSF